MGSSQQDGGFPQPLLRTKSVERRGTVCGAKERQEEWTSSIAVGSKSFVETIKERLGFKTIGQDIQGGDGAYHLRESAALYAAHFKAEKRVIGPENTSFWDLRTE